jgi:hypothetical protein
LGGRYVWLISSNSGEADEEDFEVVASIARRLVLGGASPSVAFSGDVE